MGSILQLFVIIMVAAMLVVIVREQNESISFLLVLLLGIFVFLFVLNQVEQLFNLFQSIVSKFDVSLLHLDTMIKVIGVAYLTEFISQLLKDAQLNSVAVKVEIVGKLFILLLALPIFISVLETLMSFIPQ
ncbi:MULTISPECIES: stage III sporulation protein AD [Allobacillus]|uniref:Stage III sporulation protein AD n=1 Tax=Allobacillus halotolerans TaxID=570278 RepID=A0ABS6GLV8_9BACI|nr:MULTISPECIES: stage III sporulation protein AD [Allobacillus]MBU6079625.1 stage III sporulation protein AD [Allobacillus halotolerans]TSJ68928.1 stage III sporulation protein AD [Allobacillus sp. SKP2-8]